MPTGSLVDQWDTHMYAMCVGDAVDKKQVEPLFCEDMLAPGGRNVAERKVASNLTRASAICRAKAHHMLSGIAEPTATDILGILHSKQLFFMSVAQGFKVELAFYEDMADKAGAAAVRSQIMNFMPTADVPQAEGIVVQRLADLQASKVLQFVGPTLMTETGVVKGWVEFLRDGRCPDFGDANSEFLTKARASLAFFCRVKGEDESEIVRKEAVESMLDHVTAGRSSTDSPPRFRRTQPVAEVQVDVVRRPAGHRRRLDGRCLAKCWQHSRYQEEVEGCSVQGPEGLRRRPVLRVRCGQEGREESDGAAGGAQGRPR